MREHKTKSKMEVVGIFFRRKTLDSLIVGSPQGNYPWVIINPALSGRALIICTTLSRAIPSGRGREEKSVESAKSSISRSVYPLRGVNTSIPYRSSVIRRSSNVLCLLPFILKKITKET